MHCVMHCVMLPLLRTMMFSSAMAGTYAPPAVQEPSTTASCGMAAADMRALHHVVHHVVHYIRHYILHYILHVHVHVELRDGRRRHARLHIASRAIVGP